MYNLHLDADGSPQVDYIADGMDVAEYYTNAAEVQLSAYRNAMTAYEDANERYQRALARAEAGRAPCYGNPLDIKVQSSGSGHSADDLFALVADLKEEVSRKGTAVIVAELRVRDLIHRACASGGKYATALECYYLSYLGLSYEEMSAKYPTLYHTRSVASWATARAVGQVANYLRRRDNDVANRYLDTLPTADRDAVCRAARRRAHEERAAIEDMYRRAWAQSK